MKRNIVVIYYYLIKYGIAHVSSGNNKKHPDKNVFYFNFFQMYLSRRADKDMPWAYLECLTHLPPLLLGCRKYS